MAIQVMYRFQTPRRRHVLFRGVCCFSPHFCYFSCVLFGGKKKFRIFAHCKRCSTICSTYYVNVNKLKMSRNALKLNSLSRALRKSFMLRGLICVHTIELSAHLSARRRDNFLYLMREILNSRISFKYSPIDIGWVIEDNEW